MVDEDNLIPYVDEKEAKNELEESLHQNPQYYKTIPKEELKPEEIKIEEKVIEEEPREKERIYQLTNHTLQQYNRFGARFSMNTKGVDYVYMLEQITLLKAEIGDEELKEYLNKKYVNYKTRISNFWNLVRDVKEYFDKLEKKDKFIETKEDDSELFKRQLNIIRQIKFSECCLVADAFIFLVKRCSVKDQRIPNDYFKAEERLYLKFTSWANKPQKEHPDFGGNE